MHKHSERPHTLNQRTAKGLLSRYGWQQTRRGKHAIKMENPRRWPILLPFHQGKEYSGALTDAVLRVARFDDEGSDR